MQSLEMLRRFAGNNAWSNHRLHEACARLSTEEFAARRTSFFPSIPHSLNHILIVDWYYVDALEAGGKGPSVFDPEIPFPDLAPLREAQRACDARLTAFTNRLENKADLARIVRLDRSDHVQVEATGSVLLHLFVHQIHHRGQVHAMLAGTTAAPPQLDEFFLAEELPLRKAELAELGLPLR
jgi:uncharacterized damage-inducible protein DinB